MLLIIIFIFMILLGYIFMRIDYNKFEDLWLCGVGLTVFGSFCLIISIVVIILSHGCTDNIIQKNKIQYDGLCKRYEIVKSDYEDVSKSDVIADITAWNIGVYNTKYWTENPWTSWFNPKKIADNLDYISLDE